ncbi:capsid protein [Biomphalaria glabrata]|nr:putative capsid protein [Biomphalaria glabrata]
MDRYFRKRKGNRPRYGGIKRRRIIRRRPQRWRRIRRGFKRSRPLGNKRMYRRGCRALLTGKEQGKAISLVGDTICINMSGDRFGTAIDPHLNTQITGYNYIFDQVKFVRCYCELWLTDTSSETTSEKVIEVYKAYDPDAEGRTLPFDQVCMIPTCKHFIMRVGNIYRYSFRPNWGIKMADGSVQYSRSGWHDLDKLSELKISANGIQFAWRGQNDLGGLAYRFKYDVAFRARRQGSHYNQP